jgi:hypothetical protein
LLAALRAGAFSFLPMLGPTVSFTNLKFNVSEFHLLSVCYLLLPSFYGHSLCCSHVPDVLFQIPGDAGKCWVFLISLLSPLDYSFKISARDPPEM